MRGADGRTVDVNLAGARVIVADWLRPSTILDLERPTVREAPSRSPERMLSGGHLPGAPHSGGWLPGGTENPAAFLGHVGPATTPTGVVGFGTHASSRTQRLWLVSARVQSTPLGRALERAPVHHLIPGRKRPQAAPPEHVPKSMTEIS